MNDRFLYLIDSVFRYAKYFELTTGTVYALADDKLSVVQTVAISLRRKISQ
jgi:hypothetical protein